MRYKSLIPTISSLLIFQTSVSLAIEDTYIPSETFMNPVSTAQLSHCLYGVLTCAGSTYHAAIDYSRHGDRTIVASNSGIVSRVESLNSGDHGMGNNIIVRHELVNGDTIYSSYSHLSSISSGVTEGKIVRRGETIGEMGGSGYGKSDYWGTHLHFEIKDSNVSGAPTHPAQYWGYVPANPDGYGYNNPNSYIGNSNIVEPLDSGKAVLHSISKGKWRYYSINTSASKAIIELSSLSNDVDLYVKVGSKPTMSSYLCRPYLGGSSSETCTINLNSSTTIYIGIDGYEASHYSIQATLFN